MGNEIRTIELDRLAAHPDNPNTQSGSNFAKLVRNIERTGRYEPIVVRPHPQKGEQFQIINGYHRLCALAELGYKTADCVVWDIDDGETDIMLATLNRLCGKDMLSRKIALLGRLTKKMATGVLAKLMPQTAKQIERLINPKARSKPTVTDANSFLNPAVFFLDDAQHGTIEEALTAAEELRGKKRKAARRAAALAHIASEFINKTNINTRI